MLLAVLSQPLQLFSAMKRLNSCVLIVRVSSPNVGLYSRQKALHNNSACFHHAAHRKRANEVGGVIIRNIVHENAIKKYE
jgi:hypothetical protein